MPADATKRRFLVAGGAGYIGSVLVRELLGTGHRVHVLDSLLYGNGASVSALAEHPSFSFQHGDIRSPDATREAMEGITDLVVLAALVGDPVCKLHPELAAETNVGGARNLLAAAGEAGVERLVFVSTCSNYGLREDDQPAREDDALHPLSLYAETKVEMEEEILGKADDLPFTATVLRVATAYGISPRMRFDLTISEFTRELTLGRELEVYDADTWRPYCHVADISGAVIATLDADPAEVGGEVFNVGGEESNHTKRMVVESALEALGGEGRVSFVEGGDDARNYRVSFEKIGRLGFSTRHTVAGSIGGLVAAIRAGLFADIEANGLYHRNFELRAAAPAGEGAGRKGRGVSK